MRIEDVLSRLQRVRRTGKGWVAACPAHPDKHPSLSVSVTTDGTILLKCFAGCDTAAIVRALGLRLRDLFPASWSSQAMSSYPSAQAALAALERIHGRHSRHWIYYDRQGQPVGLVVRWDTTPAGKIIRPISRREDGWVIGAMPPPRPLYRLPQLLAADPHRPVWVMEGEKCAEAGASLGLLTTTSSGGAQAAAQTDWSTLRGRPVVLLPDNDEPGRRYAEKVAQLCQEAAAADVRLLDLGQLLADFPEGGDLADLVQAGPHYYGLSTDPPHGPAELAAALDLLSRQAQTVPNRTRPWDLITMASITARSVPWLWFYRIPMGRLTLVVGRPGSGKSFFVCDLAARISTGGPWPDGGYAPMGDVLILSAEDDPSDTLRPRLDAAGADCSRIHLLRGVRVEREGRSQVVGITVQDVDVLRGVCQSLQCRAIIIDPIGSYLDSSVDIHRDNEVRSSFLSLLSFAMETSIALVAICHTRKAAATWADDLTLGSRAFVGLARAVWHLGHDPDDYDRRLFLPGKCNLCPTPDGLAFRIVGVPPRVEWEPDPVPLRGDDLVLPRGEGRTRGRPSWIIATAVEFLQKQLAGGPKPFREILSQADQKGISERTLRRAAQELGVQFLRQGMPAVTYWTLTSPSPAKNLEV